MKRLAWLDSLRVLGVVMVVLQHACTTSWMAAVGIGLGPRAVLGVASAAVPILLVVSGYSSALAESFDKRRPADLRRRLTRLGVPYLAWSALFLFAQNYLPFGRPVENLTLWGLLTGADIYVALWFLPMMMYVSVLGWSIRGARWRLAAAGLAFGIAFTPDLTVRLGDSPPAHAVGYLVSLAPLAGLFLLGQWVASLPEQRLNSSASKVALVAVGLAAAIAAAQSTMLGYPNGSSATESVHSIATAVLALALLLLARTMNGVRLLPRFADVTLGIYMMHLPLLSLLGRIVPAGVVPWYAWIPANVALVVMVTGGIGVGLSHTRMRFLVA